MCLYFPLRFQLLRFLPFFQLCAYKYLILALFLGYSNPSYLQVSQNLGTIFQYFLLRCLFLNPSQLFQKIYSNLIIRHLESLLLFALLSWLYWVASSVLEFFNKNFVLKLVGLWLIYLLFMEKISRHSIRSSKIFKYIYFHLHWYFLQKARAPSLWSNLNELLFRWPCILNSQRIFQPSFINQKSYYLTQISSFQSWLNPSYHLLD